MKKTIWSIAFLVSLLITNYPVQAQVTGIKNLVNTNSGLCLAVRGATRNNGEEGTIWTCDGNADKNWRILDAGNGFYKLQNMNSNLYLAVGAASRDNGGRVVQYIDQGQQDILWRFIDIGSGIYKIQNKNSGLFLAIGAGLREGGAPLVQWGDEGQQDIKWRLVTVSGNNPISINLTNIEEALCPKAVLRGDREFDGHGPKIKCTANLRIGDGGRALYVDIYFWAQETQSDWSTTERSWSKKVYDAPNGRTIRSIASDNFSKTQFISPPGGFQFLVPGADVAATVNNFFDGIGRTVTNAVLRAYNINAGDFDAYRRLVTGAINNGNTVVRVPSIEGTLVRFFHIVGDTGGADISDDDNCNDDTRIVKIEFNAVQVVFN